LDHISKMTDNERKIICKLIPVKCFQDHFRKNPQEFNRIWKGQYKLSQEQIEKLIMKFWDRPFLSDFLNESIQYMLDRTQEKISNHMDAGDDLHTALLWALPESDFFEYPALYVKLAHESYSAEYGELLESALRELKERTEHIPLESGLAIPPTEVSNLIDSEKIEEYSKEQLQDDLKILQNELKKAQNAFEQKEQELKSFQERVNYTDNFIACPVDTAYPFTSLCRVNGSKGNSMELIRLADLNDGIIQAQWGPDTPDRNILFTKERAKSEGDVGIWRWRTELNWNSNKADYIISELLENQRPVQIIVVPECNSVNELKEELKQGIECELVTERVLFSIVTDGKYIGLLCDSGQISKRGNTVKIRPEVSRLPLYEFHESGIVKCGQMCFFHRIGLGIPKSIYRMIEPADAVRKIVLNRASRPKMGSAFVKKEVQKFQEFLKEMPDEDFYQEIADICVCSVDEAKAYADDFVQKAETYLLAEDVESSVLAAAIAHNPTLLEKCREQNEAVWRKENDILLKDAQNELDRIRREADQQRTEYNRLKEQQNKLAEQEKFLKDEIARKEQLATEVEEKVSGRIAAAKQNAADFICEMAFAQPGMSQPASLLPAGQPELQSGIHLNVDLPEHHETWDVVCAVQDALEEAGVSDKCSLEFALFLYAAYLSRTPLLLAGPNGHAIADALSAALFGRTASVLHCEKAYTTDVIERCMKDEGQIIALINPLRAGWIDYISELASIREKLLIGVHPFSDDLMIEPRGLYNYMLPVLTELFVSSIAKGDFTGGCFGSDFQKYKPAEPQRKIPLARKVSMPPFVQNRLKQILADMKAIMRVDDKDRYDNDDYDCLFGTFPYAYAVGNGQRFWEEIWESTRLSKEAKELLKVFLGETE